MLLGLLLATTALGPLGPPEQRRVIGNRLINGD